MEMILEFDYFHVIIYEVALIGGQGSRFLLGDRVGALAGTEQKQGERCDEWSARWNGRAGTSQHSREVWDQLCSLLGVYP